ncbi:MAG: NAD(P)/FAD-dependent oxidoreductase [Candidatus Bathyarchaeia archaeon]
METYDIVVIGAGPAGLMAARKAAEQGAKTLLLEKNRTLGVKVCGEALSKQGLAEAEIPPSPKFICTEVSGINVYAPNEEWRVEIHPKELGFEEGYILEKPIFLREMAKAAVAAGAEIQVGCEATTLTMCGDAGVEIQATSVGGGLHVKARYLIGCDGINSIVAKNFFDRKGYEVISCIQYKMVNCVISDINTISVYVGSKVAPGGYIWVFPKGDGVANVGIGTRGHQAKPYLDKFIASHPDLFRRAEIIEFLGAPVPISGQIKNLVNGHVMICGDAAGQVIPLTGGGIHTSIAAGKVAGEVAGRASTVGGIDPYEYQRIYNDYWGDRIYKSLLALRVVERLSDEDLNQLAALLDGKDIVDLANGLNIERVGRKLMGHPAFARRLADALIGE